MGKLLFAGLISAIVVSLILFTYAIENRSSFAQVDTQLGQTYTYAQCGISMNYPSDWIKEESNEKFGSLTGLVTFEPDSPDYTGITVGHY